MICSRKPGLCILTATFSPVFSVALCTSPNDAAEIGYISNALKIFFTSSSRSSLIHAIASSLSNPGS